MTCPNCSTPMYPDPDGQSWVCSNPTCSGPGSRVYLPLDLDKEIADARALSIQARMIRGQQVQKNAEKPVKVTVMITAYCAGCGAPFEKREDSLAKNCPIHRWGKGVPRANPPRVMTPERVETLIKLLDQDMTRTQIAESMGIYRGTITGYICKHLPQYRLRAKAVYKKKGGR